MENVIIKDDMLKEGNTSKNPMIIYLALSAIFPIVIIWNKIKIIEFILGELFFLIIACYFLYVYLYAIKYKVSITKDRITLNTLFNHIEIDIKDIKTFSCKRYRKSQFYQFLIFTNNKKTLINTRYKNEFERILTDNKIKQK